VTSTPHIQLEALHILARALAEGEFRARAVLGRACAAVAEGFGFERVGIVRYLPASATLIPLVAYGLTDAERAALPAALPVSQFGAFERALAAGVAIFVEDPASEEQLPEEIAREFGIGSFVVVPLVSDGRCLGFMTCDERGNRFALEPAETDLLSTFGILIAAFLERAIEHGELRRLNELKSQFIAVASHELRTPVAAIYGALQTLNARESELTAEKGTVLRRMLIHQAERLYELVENLLDLSRFEANALRIEPVEIDVREKVEAVVAGLDESVSIQVEAGMRAVIDPHAFDRIVSNLLANAIRHGAPPITISASQTSEELVVTCEDRGAGVASDFVDSLFERFTRGATRSSEGAGLGLAIAQVYAQAHGGTIHYEHAEPHGALFRLTLPIATNDVIASQGDGSRSALLLPP
jgi:signal transduction histidine kinase